MTGAPFRLAAILALAASAVAFGGETRPANSLHEDDVFVHRPPGGPARLVVPATGGAVTLFMVDGPSVLAGATQIRLTDRPGGPTTLTVLNRVIVAFDDLMTPADIRHRFLVAGVAGEPRRLVGPSGRGPRNAWIVDTPTALDAINAAAALGEMSRVRYAQPDAIYARTLNSINDPQYPLQWHLNNVGQTGGSRHLDLNVEPAWEETLGAGQIVALLDTGVDVSHPDLSNGVVGEFRNSFDPDFVTQSGAHGTAMAGLIVARDNNIATRGVAPRAGLFIASVIGRPESEVIEAMYEADAAGASVVCMAWSPVTMGLVAPATVDAVRDLASTGRAGKGVVFVASAGNAGVATAWQSVFAGIPGVVNVAHYDHRGTVRQQGFGPFVDVVAPGPSASAPLATIDIVGEDGFTEDDYTPSFSGTSAAAAQAAGVAALVLSINPDLTSRQVDRLLRESARRPAPNDTGIFVGAGRPFNTLLGFSDAAGNGYLDATRAVTAAQATLSTPGLSWPERAAFLRVAASDDDGTMIAWVNPPTTADGEYDGVILVRFDGVNQWQPTDGVVYVPGKVDEDVTVVAAGDIDGAIDTEITRTDRALYAVYVRNAAGRYSLPVTVLKPVTGNILLFGEDGEGDAPDFISSGEWQRGEPNLFTARGRQTGLNPIPLPPGIRAFCRPRSGAGVWGTRLDGFYEPSRDSVLSTPAINLNRPDIVSATLTYHELLEVEGLGIDFGRVEVVEPGLAGDQLLAILREREEDTTYSWRTRSFDLTPFLGRVIRVRWTLAVNTEDPPDFYGFLGWYLDDIVVSGECVGATCESEPPPPPPPPPPPTETPPPPEPPRPGEPRPMIIQLVEILSEVLTGGAGGGEDAGAEGGASPAAVRAVLTAFGAREGDAHFNPRADVVPDGVIDLQDLAGVLRGQSAPERDWRKAR